MLQVVENCIEEPGGLRLNASCAAITVRYAGVAATMRGEGTGRVAAEHASRGAHGHAAVTLTCFDAR